MPLNILVVDDSATMRKIVAMTFAGEDARVAAVSSVEQALTHIRNGQARPDVIFADLSLPGPSGYDLSKEIKSDPSTSSIAVIALASQQTPFDPEKGKAAGFDDHVIKPFDTQVVIDRVAQILARPRATVSGVGVSPVAQVPQSGSHRLPTSPGSGAQRPPTPGSGAHQPASRVKNTVAFGAPPPTPSSQATFNASQAAPPTVQPDARRDSSRPRIATDRAEFNALSDDLNALGLSADQVTAVLALSRAVIEQVVWEVVPDLAEKIIRDEIKRLTT